jgi:hypothetical protein
MAAKLTRLTHKIAIQLRLVAGSCTICRSRRNFSLCHRVQTASGAHPASYPMSTYGYFPGVKAAGTWSYPSPPSSAKVKNTWSYTSNPPKPTRRGTNRDKFTLLYLTLLTYSRKPTVRILSNFNYSHGFTAYLLMVHFNLIIWGCIHTFPDWVDNEIYTNIWYC